MNRFCTTLLLSLFVLFGCREQEPAAPTPTTQLASTPTLMSPTATAIPPTVAPLAVKLIVPEGALRHDQPLRFEFTQPMNTTHERPVLIRPNIPTRWRWSDDGTTLTYMPQAGGWPAQSDMIVRLDSELESANGEQLERTRWMVVLADRPKVSHILPRRGQFLQPNDPMRVEFNMAMDTASVEAALELDMAQPYTLSWEDGDETLVITPDETIPPAQEVTMRLAQTAVSADGLLLKQATSHTWTMTALIQSVDKPSDAASPLSVRFGYELAAESAETLTVLLSEQPILGTVDYNVAEKTVTFAPDSYWQPATAYLLQFDELRSSSGVVFATQEERQFSTTPAIIKTSPHASHNGINPKTTVRVQFDRPMQITSTVAAFQISPTISGTVALEDETTLVFTPTKNYLKGNTYYNVTIDETALSATGERLLREPYQFDFSTQGRSSNITFGYGARVQTVDANGRRAVQFGSHSTEPAEIDYALYQLPLADFLEMQDDLFDLYEVQPDLFDLESLTLMREWNGAESTSMVDMAYFEKVAEVIIPADVNTGLYVLTMMLDDNVEDSLVVQLSDFGLLAKNGDGQITAWVSDPNDEPVSSATVRVYDWQNELISMGTTDANGVYQVNSDTEPSVVVAEHDGSTVLTGLNNGWRTGGWWGWWGNETEAATMSAAVWTDRPIYRPNQTVNFKAVIRADDDAILTLPAQGTPVTVELRDPRNNLVQTLELETNRFGAVSAEFQIADGAMLGDYGIVIIALDDSVRQRFKVQDYRKPDYKVDLSSDTTRLVIGQPLTVTIDSSYFLGEPVRDAATEIVVLHGSTRWQWNYTFQEYRQNEYWHEQKKTSRTTDDNGQITVKFDTSDWYIDGESWNGRVQSKPYLIQADVNDGSNQNVAGAVRVELFEAAEILSLKTEGYFFDPDDMITVNGTVRDIHGDPVANREVDLRVTRYSYETYNNDNTIERWDVVTDENGEFTHQFSLEEGNGSYRLQGSMEDEFGNHVGYRAWFYVYREGASRWWGSSANDFSLQADKDSYTAGEMVKLLAESTFEGYGLLTVERGTTRREQIVRLTPPVTLLELPLEATDAPNIYISIAAWESNDTTLAPNSDEQRFNLNDASMRIATTGIPVAVENKRLDVSIETDRQTYAPRDEAMATIRVTDENGVGVSAELSLAVVDEAIFTLSDDLSTPLFDAFYYERDHRITNYDSYQPYRYLGGFGGGGGGGDGAGQTPRSDFPDTALWLPNIETDANGVVTVPLTLPDSLTQFRLTARATTLTTQVGEETALITTTQAIRVRPLLPRTVTAGDEFELSTLVQNISGLTTTLTIDATWDDLLGEPVEPLTITLGVDEQRIVGWGVVAEAEGEAILVVRAISAENTLVDAVEMPLTIAPLAVLDVNTWTGSLTDESFEFTVENAANALPSSVIEIDISRSVAGTLLEGLDYLTGYPYGCVEQTMSRALPNAVVSRAFAQLGVASPDIELDRKINASLQRLYSFQHSDGGWGWWHSDPSDHYQSAWVLFGLALIQEADYEVSPEVIKKGIDYLQETLPEMDVRTRAYALYSLSLVDGAEADAMSELLDEPLDLFSKTALALAFANSGDDAQGRTLLNAVMADATTLSNGHVYWKTGVHDGYYRQKTMASDIRTTALILSAMSQLAPDNELIDGTVEYLMANRKRSGWGTTNETSYAILGLSDYLLAQQSAEDQSTTYTVEIDGEAVAGGVLGRGSARGVVVISADDLDSNSKITLTQSGDNPLYYVVNQRSYLAQQEIAAAGAISVTRTYQHVAEDGTKTVVNQFKEGDLVLVTLEVRSDDELHYLLIEDSLPGGLEPLNSALDTTPIVNPDYDNAPYRNSAFTYTHKEVHSDRVTFFITERQSGLLTLTYYARATRTGDFVALPVVAEAMYNPAQWGRSKSTAISVEQ